MRQYRDDAGLIAPLPNKLSSPQNNIINAASAAFIGNVVRIHSVTDCYILFSPLGDVCTSVTGHFLAAGGVYDLPVGAGNTKIYVLGTANLSELW
jgi:hypothetical protein